MSFNAPAEQMSEYYENIENEMAIDQWICMNAYFWDHPEYRGVSSTFNADFTNLYESNGKIYGNIRMEIELTCEDMEKMKNELDKIRTIVDSIEIPEGSTYEQAKALHDYVCSNISYDLSAEDGHSVYGALTQKKASCDGYARTYKVLCDKYGIESALVVGDAMNSDGGYDGHMWNVVRMDDDQWYAVDTTWDQGETNYNFFLVGNDTVPDGWEVSFADSHLPSAQHMELGIYSATLELPELSPERYEAPKDVEISCTLWDTYDSVSETFGNQIQNLTYSSGSFFWDNSGTAELYPHKKTYFDQFYLKVDCTFDRYFGDTTVQLELPEGFSFSETELISQKSRDIGVAKEGETYTFSEIVYPIYAENYTDRFNMNMKVGTEEIPVYLVPINRNANEGKIAFEETYYEAKFDTNWFAQSSYQYNHELAKYSLALSGMEYRTKEQIEESWYNLGFSGIKIYEYDDTDEDYYYVNFSIAKKKILIDGKIVTLIAAPMRGTVGTKEWVGNLYLGTEEEEHKVFEIAKNNVASAVYQYKNEHNLYDQKLKLLLCGHSRAAAVANLLAAEFDRTKLLGIVPSDIYAYTYATPNVTTKGMVRDELYNNIFNIVDYLDMVPSVPLKSMGYDKYGNTFVIANRWVENYENTKRRVSVEYSKYKGDESYEPIEIMDYIDMFDFPSEEKDKLIEILYKELDITDLEEATRQLIEEALEEVLEYFKDDPAARKKLSKEKMVMFNGFLVTVDVLTTIDIDYIKKLICTHTTASYMAWMENSSGIWPEGMYRFKCLQIACPVDVEIYNSNGRLVGRIASNTVDETIENGICTFTEGDIKYAILPGDGEYSVKIVGTDNGTMSYSIIEYDEDGELYRVVTADGIEVTNGKTFRGEINSITGTPRENYRLICDDQSIVSMEKELMENEIFVSASVLGNGEVRGTGFYTAGETVELRAIPENSQFEGWYQDGELVSTELVYSFTSDTDVLLQARFTEGAAEAGYQVTFDSKGGTPVEIQIVAVGGKVQEPETPVKDGYQFDGWYYNGERYDFSTIVTADMLLEAGWIQNSTSNPSGGGSSGSGGSSGGSGSGGGSGSSPSASSSNTDGTPDYVVKGGTWVLHESGKWQYINGRVYTNEWAALENPYADASMGQSTFDWFRFDENGFMVTGWFTDEYGDSYYLNPVSDGTQGRMITGWFSIDNAWYFFTKESNGKKGAMFKNTATPDGKTVNEKGQYVVDGVVQQTLD